MCAKIKQNALYNFTHDFNNNNIQSILSLILQPAYGLFDCEKIAALQAAGFKSAS
jgi:hypothetical protein